MGIMYKFKHFFLFWFSIDSLIVDISRISIDINSVLGDGKNKVEVEDKFHTRAFPA